jgi:hypothetical protein
MSPIGSARQLSLDDGFSSVIAWRPYLNERSGTQGKSYLCSALDKEVKKIEVGVVLTFGRDLSCSAGYLG